MDAGELNLNSVGGAGRRWWALSGHCERIATRRVITTNVFPRAPLRAAVNPFAGNLKNLCAYGHQSHLPLGPQPDLWAGALDGAGLVEGYSQSAGSRRMPTLNRVPMVQGRSFFALSNRLCRKCRGRKDRVIRMRVGHVSIWRQIVSALQSKGAWGLDLPASMLEDVSISLLLWLDFTPPACPPCAGLHICARAWRGSSGCQN
jgi:hypothetical protein